MVTKEHRSRLGDHSAVWLGSLLAKGSPLFATFPKAGGGDAHIAFRDDLERPGCSFGCSLSNVAAA